MNHPHYNIEVHKANKAIPLITLAAIVLMAWKSCSTSDNSAPHIISTDEVYVISEQVIKSKLKSPATANFPVMGRVAKEEDGSYVVQSYVDAQNSFGANLRTYWICQLKYKGGEWGDINNWEIIESSFL